MRNLQRARNSGFGLLAALPLLVDWFYRFLIVPRPFWIHYYDAESVSFFQALRIALGDHPTYIDHPGTPVQVIGAVIVAFTGRSASDIQPFLRAGYVFALIASLCSIATLRRTIFRDASPWLWVLACWTFWMAPAALDYQNIWCAETLFFPAATLALAALARIDDRWKSVVLAGIAVGFCVSVKFVFLAWLAGYLVMLATESRPLQARVVRCCSGALSALAGFVLGTSAAVLEYPRMLRWLLSLTKNRGAYGVGEAGLPDVETVVRTYAALAWNAKWLVLWTAILVVLFVTQRRHLHPLSRFALAAIACSILLGLRAPSAEFRYFLPIPLALIAIVATFDAPLPRWVVAAATALTIVAVTHGVIRYRRFIGEQLELRVAIDAATSRYAPGGVVLYTGRVPEPSFALQALTEEKRFLDQIAAKYPKRGHWVPWHEGIQLPPNAPRWDVVVLHEQWAPVFPEPIGRIVTIIPPYRVALHPAPAGTSSGTPRSPAADQ